MKQQQPGTERLIKCAARSDDRARPALLMRFYDRLARMAAVRLDRRLAPRGDAADVVQEALLEASQNLSEYLHERSLPFHAWLRQDVGQKISKLHRHHLGPQRRSVRLEVAWSGNLPGESTIVPANRLVGHQSIPS